MPPRKRNKRVPKDMSHITNDPSKCGLQHWGMKLEAAFPPQTPGAAVPEVGPATGPAHGQELTLAFSPPTKSLPLDQGSQPRKVHDHRSAAPPPQGPLETSSSYPMPSTIAITKNLHGHPSQLFSAPSSLTCSPAAVAAGGSHGQTIATSSPSRTQTEPSVNLALYPSDVSGQSSLRSGAAYDRPGQPGTDNGYYLPSPLPPHDIPLQVPYTPPAAHPGHLSPGFIHTMSGLQLSNSPSTPDASLSDSLNPFYSYSPDSSQDLFARKDGNLSSSGPHPPPSHEAPEFGSDDPVLLFPNSSIPYLEASPDIAVHRLQSSNVDHFRDPRDADPSRRSFGAYSSSVTRAVGHLSPLSYSFMDDELYQGFYGDSSHLESSLNPVHTTHSFNTGGSSMQPEATHEDSGLGAKAPNLDFAASPQSSQVHDVQSDAHEVSRLSAMDRRRQRNPFVSLSFSLPSSREATVDSPSSLAHSRGDPSRRRTYPYRRPSRDVHPSARSTAPIHRGGLHLVGEVSDNSAFGLRIPDSAIPPHLPVSTISAPFFDPSDNSTWGADISMPSGSRPHRNPIPRVMRTSLRSSELQQPPHAHAMSPSGSYDTNALQLQDVNDANQSYDFDLFYPGNSAAGWPDPGRNFFR